MLGVNNLPLWLQILPLIIGVLIAVLSGVFAIINRRGGEKQTQTRSTPPTWPEMWDRLETLAERIRTLEQKLDEVKDDRDALRDVFIRYVDRVQAGGSNKLTHAERARLQKPHKEEGNHS